MCFGGVLFEKKEEMKRQLPDLDEFSRKQTEKKLKAAESFTLVDCRMPKAYAESHIDGAINIPFTVFENSYHEIPKDKPVVLVCYLGMFSRVGAKLLVENGYQAVYSLVGGMKEWDKMHKI